MLSARASGNLRFLGPFVAAQPIKILTLSLAKFERLFQVTDKRGRRPGQSVAAGSPGPSPAISRNAQPIESLYSTDSRNASQLASMIFSLTPTVPQIRSPSPLSIKTRVRAPVPEFPSRMRTL